MLHPLLTFRKMSERDACGCRIPATVRRRTEIREYPRLAERHSVTKTALFPSLRHHAPPPLRMASPAASAIPPQTRQSVNRILHASAFLPEEKTHPKPRFSPPARSPKTALRQEISVFAERKIFLSAKKSALYRSPDCIYAVTTRIYAAFMEYSCPPSLRIYVSQSSRKMQTPGFSVLLTGNPGVSISFWQYAPSPNHMRLFSVYSLDSSSRYIPLHAAKKIPCNSSELSP